MSIMEDGPPYVDRKTAAPGEGKGPERWSTQRVVEECPVGEFWVRASEADRLREVLAELSAEQAAAIREAADWLPAASRTACGISSSLRRHFPFAFADPAATTENVGFIQCADAPPCPTGTITATGGEPVWMRE